MNWSTEKRVYELPPCKLGQIFCMLDFFFRLLNRISRSDQIHQNSWLHTFDWYILLHGTMGHRMELKYFLFAHFSLNDHTAGHWWLTSKKGKVRSRKFGQIFKSYLNHFTVLLCSIELYSSLATIFAQCSSSTDKQINEIIDLTTVKTENLYLGQISKIRLLMVSQ